jgi:hypothetical protein
LEKIQGAGEDCCFRAESERSNPSCLNHRIANLAWLASRDSPNKGCAVGEVPRSLTNRKIESLLRRDHRLLAFGKYRQPSRGKQLMALPGDLPGRMVADAKAGEPRARVVKCIRLSRDIYGVGGDHAEDVSGRATVHLGNCATCDGYGCLEVAEFDQEIRMP